LNRLIGCIGSIRFIHLGFNTPLLAAHSVIPAKAEIQITGAYGHTPLQMPDQVLHDETTSITCGLLRGGSFDKKFLRPRNEGEDHGEGVL
jgi:hypothetical protein